jgi:hypothetical protein
MSFRQCPDCGSLTFTTDQNCAVVPTTYCQNPDCNWYGDPTAAELQAIGYTKEQYDIALATYQEE